MYKQNKSPQETVDDEQTSDVYDVYIMTESMAVDNVFDGSKKYLTIEDLFHNHEYDVYGDDFVNEEEWR